MRDLSDIELSEVSGGAADFSGVTATVDSTEVTIEERDKVHAILRALN